MEHNQYVFSVLSPNKATTFPMGLCVKDIILVKIPKNTDYIICVDSFVTHDTHHKYFSVDVKIGDRRVIIDDKHAVYYNSKIYITGFNGHRDNKFTHNVNNEVVNIKISTFYRIPTPFNDKFVCTNSFSTTLLLSNAEHSAVKDRLAEIASELKNTQPSLMEAKYNTVSIEPLRSTSDEDILFVEKLKNARLDNITHDNDTDEDMPELASNSDTNDSTNSDVSAIIDDKPPNTSISRWFSWGASSKQIPNA